MMLAKNSAARHYRDMPDHEIFKSGVNIVNVVICNWQAGM